MKSRFEHEINMGRYFLEELETYLTTDTIKAREAAESKILDMQFEHKKEIDVLKEELRVALLRVAELGLEKGRLLKEIDRLVEHYVPKEESKQEADATGVPY